MRKRDKRSKPRWVNAIRPRRASAGGGPPALVGYERHQLHVPRQARASDPSPLLYAHRTPLFPIGRRGPKGAKLRQRKRPSAVRGAMLLASTKSQPERTAAGPACGTRQFRLFLPSFILPSSSSSRVLRLLRQAAQRVRVVCRRPLTLRTRAAFLISLHLRRRRRAIAVPLFLLSARASGGLLSERAASGHPSSRASRVKDVDRSSGAPVESERRTPRVEGG